MPKVLNTEKLEIKFSNLTRARDSILALSSWIMRHSEFCESIVEEWLAGLSKDFNALAMFYVANDVIINCGKKRVPQYRTAFSKVLKNALMLPNIKTIKKEVSRVIKIWQERSIYDEEFCEILQNALNSAAVIEDSYVKSPLSTEEEEQSEADIIANFKQKDLFDKLIKLKYTVEQSNEKEDILKYAEEPRKPNMEIMGLKECQSLLQKVDRYCEAIRTSVKLLENEISVRNKVLKELKNNTIFYSVQNEDVRKVVHAYRIYGKKIKNVLKNLSVKNETLPSCSKNSPSFSDHDLSSPKSPDDAFSHQESSPILCESSQSTFHSLVKNQGPMQPDIGSDFTINSPFANKFPQNDNLESFQNLFKEQETNANKSISTENDSLKDFEQEIASFKSSNITNMDVDNVKHKVIEDDAESSCISGQPKISDSEFMDYNNLISDESHLNFKSPSNKNAEFMKTGNKLHSAHDALKHESPKKSKILPLEISECTEVSNSSTSPIKTSPKYGISFSTDSSIINSEKSTSVTSTNAKSDTAIAVSSLKQKETDVKMNNDLEDVDKLLEKSYRRENIKRKIELLLKTRGNKSCQATNQHQNSSSPLSETKHAASGVKAEKMDVQNSQSIEKSVAGTEGENSKQCEKYQKEADKTDLESNQAVKKFKRSNSFSTKCTEGKGNMEENIVATDRNVDELSKNSSSKQFMNDSNSKEIDDCDNIETFKEENIFKNKQSSPQAGTDCNRKSPVTLVSDIIQDSCDADTNSSLGSCFSISTEQLKNILSKNENIDLQHSNETNMANISEVCSSMDMDLSNNSLFASICSPSSSVKYDQIPGLEISKTPEKEKTDSSKGNSLEINPKEKSENIERVHKEKNQLHEVKYELKDIEESREESLSSKSDDSSRINTSQASNSIEYSTDFQIKFPLGEECIKSALENASQNTDKIELNNNIDTIPLDIGSSTSKLSNDSVIVNSDAETNASTKRNITVSNMNNKNDLRKLAQTFQGILEYISKQKTKHIQSELPGDLPKQSSNITLENYLRIYGALQSTSTIRAKTSQVNSQIKIEEYKNQLENTKCLVNLSVVNHNSTTDYCTTTNALHGPILSTCDSKSISSDASPNTATQKPSSLSTSVGCDNLEVTDMDCDSE